MKMKKAVYYFMMVSVLIFAACSKDDNGGSDSNDDDANNGGNIDGISGDMTVIDFEAGETYLVTGDLFVPEDKLVTIPEGVTLEFQEGPAGEAWFLEVFGSLYVMGQENARVTFTASEELINSSKNQGIGQLWGGIIGTIYTGDLVIQYADILHAGGTTREENAMAQPATSNELSAGDASYALYFIREDGERQDGIFVLRHSRVAFTPDDGCRINGGKTLWEYNTFEVTGGTGGDTGNFKAGTTGDFAFNLFYNLATNGLKIADTGPGTRGFAEANFYNNTILNSGFRRAEAGRGAGLNYESDAFGKCYNNLQVNLRFGLRLVAGESEPRVSEMEYGHNWYYGANQNIVDEFYPTNATSSYGLIGNDPRTPIDPNDVAGGPGENDPMFVNYDPSTFDSPPANNVSGHPLSVNIDPIPVGANFHLQPGSPALIGGKIDFSPVHSIYTT